MQAGDVKLVHAGDLGRRRRLGGGFRRLVVALRHRADIGDVAARGRQLAADTVSLRQRNNLHLFSPEGGGQRFNVVPVIHRQIEPEFRLVHTVHQQPAVWHLCDRHPGFKLRIDLEGIRMVIKKDVYELAGVNK